MIRRAMLLFRRGPVSLVAARAHRHASAAMKHFERRRCEPCIHDLVHELIRHGVVVMIDFDVMIAVHGRPHHSLHSRRFAGSGSSAG